MATNRISPLYSLTSLFSSLLTRISLPLLMAMILSSAINARADVRQEALDSILPKYSNWGTAELSGKLRAPGLPVTPTLRFYLKKGEEIQISVRAPFVGEAGRICVAGDSVIAVNKMKGVYCKESLAGIKYDFPDIISDIQTFLLGRVLVFKAGELGARNADFVDIREAGGNEDAVAELKKWIISWPKGRTVTEDNGYEYRINSDARVESLMVEIGEYDVLATASYTYNKNNGAEMKFNLLRDDEVKLDISIEFDPVKWGAQAPDPIKITDKYRQVALKDFLKSF